MRWRQCYLIALLAWGVAQPAAAANPGSEYPDQSDRTRVGAYFGATLMLHRTGDRRMQPNLRFGLSGRSHIDRMPAGFPASQTPMFELDLTAAKHPQFYFGGRNLSAAEGGGGWGAGEILLAAAGAAGIIFLVSTVANSNDDKDEGRCLIEPELCN